MIAPLRPAVTIANAPCWLKLGLDTWRLKLSWARVPELGSVHAGQDPPRGGSAESCWDWFAAVLRGRQPNCGGPSTVSSLPLSPDQLPQRAEVPSLGPGC